jgi:hypothetical protein
VYSVAPLQARGPGVGDAVGIGVGEIVGATVGLAVGLAAGVGRGVGALAGRGSGAVTVGLLLSFEQPTADINRNVVRSVIAQPENRPVTLTSAFMPHLPPARSFALQSRLLAISPNAPASSQCGLPNPTPVKTLKRNPNLVDVAAAARPHYLTSVDNVTFKPLKRFVNTNGS